MASKKKPEKVISEIPFAPLEELLGDHLQKPDGKPIELLIDDLHPFPNQPFRPYKEEQMEEMVKSVQQNGIINPILVRPNPNGDGYEIISGHNRVEASHRANLSQVPAFIREMDDDTAIIFMVDSNLRQRSKLLPSEKAKAYRMKMEALRRQGERRDLTSCHDGTKFRSDNAVAEDVQDSARQVQRFIRLNSLSPALMDMVDDGKLALTPAVEISYLDKADQEIVQQILERDQVSPSLSQAQKLRKLSDEDKISDTEIDRILTVEKPMYETIVFRRSKIEQFFPAGMTGKEIEEKLYSWMLRYQKEWQSRLEKEQER